MIWIDYILFAVYMAAIIGIGYRMSESRSVI